MSDAVDLVPTGASALGYHMINMYQQCNRKWHLRYNLGITPTKMGKALVFGRAWHSGMEVFYRGGTAEAALEKIKFELNFNKGDYRDIEDLAGDLAKAEVLFPIWVTNIGSKLFEEYDVLSIEEQYEPRIADMFTFTIRPDAVLRRRSDHRIFVPEHKTTGMSIQTMFGNVDTEDQATAYSWGLLKAHPEYESNFGGILLDVAFCRLYKGKPSGNPDVQQTTIYRTKNQLQDFEMSMLGLFTELARKRREWDAGRSDTYLYARNGHSCTTFGCEYSDICRVRIDSHVPLSTDYRIEPWTAAAQLLREAEGC